MAGLLDETGYHILDDRWFGHRQTAAESEDQYGDRYVGRGDDAESRAIAEIGQLVGW